MSRYLRYMVAFGLLAVAPLSARAQSREVTGKVTEAVSNLPLSDVTVSIVGSQIGARTNEKGEYRIQVPRGEVSLQARRLGNKRQLVKVTAEATTADFSLEKDVLQLEGVSVTGQATTVDRRSAATAVSSVSAEELVRVPARSVEGNLAGKVAGARVFDNSGAPGGGAQIQIRGATSILGQGDPLYVVDGVIISNAGISSGASSITRASGSTGSNQDQVVNRLADLNPNDIDNIEVLKSAAATAIYGSRATNGVVVITTKRGKENQPRWNLTQRVGTQSQLRSLGSRKFATLKDVYDPANDVNWTGGPVGLAAAQAACNPNCTFYDWQDQLYGQTLPSYETLLSASGGMNKTRYFVSANDRQESGIMINTGARRTGGRMNIDQQLGSKLTVGVGVDITRNSFHRGVGGNDNSGTSPIYTFGYSPAIIDLQAKTATGRFVNMPFNGGGSGTSNPFEVMRAVTNKESVWRQSGNARLGYSLVGTNHNTVQLSYLAGVDRFQQEGYQYSPNYLQYEAADGFLGTAAENNVSSFQFNQGGNAVWTYTPGANRFFTSFTTSVGTSYETQNVKTYRIRGRGLLPTRAVAAGAQDVAIVDQVEEFRDQSYYVNEQALFFNERLAINGGYRADRSSANGDREQYYLYPKVSASYRFVKPLTSKIDEVKFRAAKGQSGNRPRYGDRDILFADGGLISGNGSLVSASLLGNPQIKPEIMNELEFGFDASLFGSRIGLEGTRYERVITDLLLTFPLPPSSGLGNQIKNGGQLSVQGIEAVFSAVPLRSRSFEWTTRVIYNHNTQHTDNIPVPAFNVAGGSFGAAYGRNRIQANTVSTLIWGNVPFCAGKSCDTNTLLDANPISTTTFNNDFTFKRLTFSALLDWRAGGYVSDMTNNLFDEGGQSRDYDDPSPVAGYTKLGDYRYDTFNKGDIRPYIQSGSYVKLREVAVAFDMPENIAKKIPGARSLRVNLQGRNLALWSKYWSYDPEFNNFGNSNFNR
ncbi:MAG: SusC/RagA family TonB-linked outer membrane protein, partial [Gemmatimonadaceae bacterium]